MAKITISRLFEVSQYLATEAGQQLSDALIYLSEFVEVITRSLRNGLNFQENLDCRIRQVALTPNTESIIFSADPRDRRATQVMVRRVVDDVYYVLDSFGWKYNSLGQLVVKAGFSGSPPSSEQITVELIIFFG